MATIAPLKPKTRLRGGTSGGGKSGGGLRKHGGGRPSPGGARSDRRYYTGMMVGLGGVVMLFTAFTSAFFVRKGLSDDWLSMSLPPLLWINTVALLASSFTLEKARRHLRTLPRFRQWWLATTALGILFLAGQVAAWLQLSAQGVYVSTNPSSSFFYVLTAAHSVHLAGGVIALLALTGRLWLGSLSRTAVDVTAIYWHFMDVLWIYLLVLLTVWR